MNYEINEATREAAIGLTVNKQHASYEYHGWPKTPTRPLTAQLISSHITMANFEAMKPAKWQTRSRKRERKKENRRKSLRSRIKYPVYAAKWPCRKRYILQQYILLVNPNKHQHTLSFVSVIQRKHIYNKYIKLLGSHMFRHTMCHPQDA